MIAGLCTVRSSGSCLVARRERGHITQHSEPGSVCIVKGFNHNSLEYYTELQRRQRIGHKMPICKLLLFQASDFFCRAWVSFFPRFLFTVHANLLRGLSKQNSSSSFRTPPFLGSKFFPANGWHRVFEIENMKAFMTWISWNTEERNTCSHLHLSGYRRCEHSVQTTQNNNLAPVQS